MFFSYPHDDIKLGSNHTPELLCYNKIGSCKILFYDKIGPGHSFESNGNSFHLFEC